MARRTAILDIGNRQSCPWSSLINVRYVEAKAFGTPIHAKTPEAN